MNTKRMRIEEKKLAMVGSSDPVQESPNKLDDVGTLLPFDFMLERNKANHEHDENHQVYHITIYFFSTIVCKLK